MAGSVVEIANRALEAIGADPITSLDDESKPARLCRRLYPQLRDEIIRNHPWNCAAARDALPALATAPAWGFAFAYELPVDCIRVWRVQGATVDTDWRVEGRTIATNLPAPLRIEYGRRVEDPAQLDALLVSVIVARLAMELAMPVSDSQSMRQQMEREYRRLLREARGVDAQEGAAPRIEADEFLASRF